ncbi:MAG: LCP family protein [Ruminiclostridium sp.]
MSVKRKSNWYIYIITFIITAVLLGLVVWKIWDYLFPAKETISVSASGITDFRPDASNNMTVLLMLSEEKAAIPEYYMLVSYRPKDEVISLVPLRNDIYATEGGVSGNLMQIYQKNGSQGVMYAMENLLDVKCDYYVKFDKYSFIELANFGGTVSVNIPYTLTDPETGDLDFASGAQILDGGQLYKYITYKNFTEGIEYTNVVLGSVISSMINQNFRGLTTTDLQTIANMIINNADTDFKFDDYTARQKAFLYTTENTYNPAEYYIPYGETDEQGNFILAENSVSTIRDRMGIEEQ